MFEYFSPPTVAQACALLAEDAEVRPLLGGTDLFVQLRTGRRRVRALVDLKRIPELDGIADTADGGLRLGARVTMNRLLAEPRVAQRYAVLHAALARIAAYPVRNRATLAGNLVNASPAADSAPALLVLGASVELVGPQGTRVLPLQQFLLGPGATALQQGELLSAVLLPGGDWAAVPGAYGRQARRRALDLAIAGVAVAGRRLDGDHWEWRLAACAVAPTPLRLHAAELELADGPPDDARLTRAAQAAAQAVRPIDDIRASADYRRQMVEVHAHRSLLAVRDALGAATR